MPPSPNESESGGGPDDVRIEPATADDLDRVVDHWLSMAADQRDLGSHVLAEANERTVRQILGAHRSADGLLVARSDDHVVGFASFSVEQGPIDLDARRATLSNVYVVPAARNEGIGTALLDAVEATLADRGVDVLTLEAMAANEAARRFYRRRGYDVHRVTMERRLETGSENDTHSKDRT